MKRLPIDYPDLSETPLQRKLRAWEREDEHQRCERLRLWEEVRVKVEQLPALMDEAKAKAEADGSLTQGYIETAAQYIMNELVCRGIGKTTNRFMDRLPKNVFPDKDNLIP